MTEVESFLEIQQRILDVLESDLLQKELTLAQIKEGLELDPGLDKLVYPAIKALISRRQIRRRKSPANLKVKLYSLIKTTEFPTINSTWEEWEKTGNGILVEQMKSSRFLELASSEWNFVSSPEEFPPHPGLYGFFNSLSNACLYIGRAADLEKRGAYHEVWQKALFCCVPPKAGYMLLQNEHPEVVKRELYYSECLLIGVLRPRWNVMPPNIHW